MTLNVGTWSGRTARRVRRSGALRGNESFQMAGNVVSEMKSASSSSSSGPLPLINAFRNAAIVEVIVP